MKLFQVHRLYAFELMGNFEGELRRCGRK